jgi:serpin B
VNLQHGALIGYVDFVHAKGEAIELINSWVSGKTCGRIDSIISDRDVDELTRAILVNAIYFKGKWANEFNPSNTYKESFYLAGPRPADARHWISMDREPGTVKASFMKRTEKNASYYEDDDNQAVELPYKGNDVSMLFVLPKGEETRINPLTILSRTSHKEVRLHIPKFKMNCSFALKSPLQALGIKKAFSDDEANFTGITTEQPGLVIDEVLHKAFVEVNEEGTEAAAATVVVARFMCCLPSPVKEFRANHPFLFYIIDKKTGTILFNGRVSDPTKEE